MPDTHYLADQHTAPCGADYTPGGAFTEDLDDVTCRECLRAVGA